VTVPGVPPGRRVLVVSCEHTGRSVPAAWVAAFEGIGAPLHAATTTRLLIDTNRSIAHRQLFSEVTARLPPARRRAIVERAAAPIAMPWSTTSPVIPRRADGCCTSGRTASRRCSTAWLGVPTSPGSTIRGALPNANWRPPGCRRSRGVRRSCA